MVRRIMIFLVLIFIFICPTITAFATNEESTLPEEYEDFIESIPEDIAELLPEGLFENSPDGIINAVKELTDWEYILDYVFNIIGLNSKEIIKAFAILLSLLILCALLKMFKNTLNNSAIECVVDLISGITIVVSIMEICKAPIESSMNLLNNMRIFVNSMSPTISAMYAMGGNLTSALVHNYGLIVFLSILENICIIALELILGLCMALTLSSVFVGNTDLLSLSNGIKKIFTSFWGIIMLVFTTVLSTQSLLASKADSLSSKTAKMFATQMIPLAGGTVGESLRTAGASVEYLRSNVGVVLIVILVILVAPTLISISLYRLMFIVANAMANLVGCEKEGRIIKEISSIYGYVLAILSVCAIILLFLITIFAKCASPMV